MSVNRLAELHKNTQYREGVSPGYMEMNTISSEKQGSLERFLAEIVNIKETIAKINKNVDTIESMITGVFEHSDAFEIQRSRMAMDEVSNETQGMMNHVRQKLKEIEPCSGQSELRTRKNTFSSVTESFMTAIKRRRKVAHDFQNAEAQQLARQIKIANPNATSQEIQNTIDNVEQGKSNVFTDQILEAVDSQYRRQSAQNTLYAAQERREDLYKLTKRINELSELFNEMQTLVQHQALVVDEIEGHVEKVTEDLEVGVRELGEGVEIAKRTRRLRKCYAIGCIIALIIIILVIVLAVYFNVNK